MINKIINISGYKFVTLDNLPELQSTMLGALKAAGVLGTILIAEEGINIALAGTAASIGQARQWFAAQAEFSDIWLKESESAYAPFSKLKVRIRPEVIAFDRGKTRPADTPAPAISPDTLRQWLDEGQDFILLDTRNTYETDAGTFDRARLLDLENFRDFPESITQLDPDSLAQLKSKPVVTFCTGGIRCEKAAPWMQENGFGEVYQLHGGILNYFEQCGGSHWKGDCFVFDDRVEINTSLKEIGTTLCSRCFRAASKARLQKHEFTPDEHCEDCILAQQRLAS